MTRMKQALNLTTMIATEPHILLKTTIEHLDLKIHPALNQTMQQRCKRY
jgi:hypothetical protein